MRKLYEIFKVLKVQKRIVSVETIRGNTVVATPQNLWHEKQGCSLFYPLDLYCEKLPKMTLFIRVGK